MKNTNQFALVLGLLDEEDAIMSQEHICSLCNVRRTAVTCSVQKGAVGGRLYSTVCMARGGMLAAFVWLGKPKTIEDHVLYHATVVSSRCTRQ